MTLVKTLTISTANQRIVSPLLCGSHPYPYGSLTYYTPLKNDCQPKVTVFEHFFLFYLGKQRTILLQISSTSDLGAAIFSLACSSPSLP